MEWVDVNYPEAQWHAEVPAQTSRAAGGDWKGTIDLLLQLPNDELVLIDHKSAPIRRESCESKARQYTGQLAVYQEVLTHLGESVESTWIHFPLTGMMAQIESV